MDRLVDKQGRQLLCCRSSAKEIALLSSVQKVLQDTLCASFWDRRKQDILEVLSLTPHAAWCILWLVFITDGGDEKLGFVSLLQRIKTLIYTFSKATFRHTKTPFAQVLLCRSFLGFNGQFLRSLAIFQLLKHAGFDAFIETGTNTGNTCLLVAGQTRLPIYSSESNSGYYQQACRTLIPFGKRIQLYHGDSRSFLKNLLSSRRLKRPFIYLDAHWYADWPLLAELNVALSIVSEFVIMIDDFQVESDEGFGYDCYNGVVLNFEYIKSTCIALKRDLHVFVPAYPSALETGMKRGYILIASPSFAEMILELVPTELFSQMPLNLDRSTE